VLTLHRLQHHQQVYVQGANSVLTANTVSPTYTYCPTTHSSGCSGDDITLVVLNTLNNPTSGCGGASRYTYFTGGGAQTTSLTATILIA
jgi:hypothetical protein